MGRLFKRFCMPEHGLLSGLETFAHVEDVSEIGKTVFKVQVNGPDLRAGTKHYSGGETGPAV